ncbi:MAG: ATP-binding protein [Candidatus Omnitrophota bacterium]|jgi:anti-sigma regulatory factor (Ser/Thr protein kinase)
MPELVLPAILKNLDPLMAFITDAAGKMGFDDKKIFHIKLASEEILVNIINYAYPGGQGDIEIIVNSRGAEALVVAIADRGIAFDPLSLPEPDISAPLEKRTIGGLGVFLARKLMDEVTYRREEGRNILTFVKRKSSDQA